MTPLWRFWSRWLPRGAVWFAVTLCYAAGLLLFLFLARVPQANIVYVDVEEGQ